MAEGIEKPNNNTAEAAKDAALTVDAKQYAEPIGPIRVTKLSDDFLKKVDKTDRNLERSIIKLNKFGKTEEATELLRLNERLGTARAHHNDHRAYKIGQQDANSALTKIHDEAVEKIKQAKSQISKLRLEKAGNFVKSKKFLIPVAAVGAIAAASVFASKRNKQEREDEVAHRRQNTQELREDVAVLKAAQNSQPTLMGEQLREGEHAARVRAGRSNGAEPVINPANPPVDLNYQVVR